MNLKGLINDFPNVTLGEMYTNYSKIRDETTNISDKVARLEKNHDFNNLKVDEVPTVMREIKDIVYMLRGDKSSY